MSIEGILLFVFFVVMPLVQQWRERQKKQQQSQRPAPRRVPAQADVPVEPPTEILEDDGFEWGSGWEPVQAPPTPPPPAPRPRPTALPGPVRVETRPHIARVPQPARQTGPQHREDPVPSVRAARVHRRQSAGAARGLSGRADLRQAIRQMTILGPCRATAPYGRE
jgi:hypothetical protein